METDTTIADQNTERLIQAAYQPEAAAPKFVADMEKLALATAQGLAQQQTTTAAPRNRWRRAALVLSGIAACLLLVFALWNMPKPLHVKPIQMGMDVRGFHGDPPLPKPQPVRWTDDVRDGMMPRQRPAAPALKSLKPGETLATKPGERRLVQLGDGTKLYVNEKTEVEAKADRQLTLHKGQIYLEVAPKDDAAKFVVNAANRDITATGTHFAVQSDPVASGVVVTQGKVAVTSGERERAEPLEVTAGQRVAPGESKISTAPRASHALEWTRELMAAAETPMVPACRFAGGALLALDPQGQEIKLALRSYNIDVHIEDGFARTTIDQTYFNTTWDRLEGTFYFPLPADASLSRLAMYVADGNNQCKLMEGGMAERKHAADVYETIRYMRRDPALLEWLDGSTFKMRVFPLEAKQEKRIILSYTQKLPSLYGNTRYRFAGGHNMPLVRDWSFTARVKSGAGMSVWSPTHENMHRIPQTGDVLMTQFERNIKPEQDVVIEMQEPAAVHDQDVPRFSTFLYENHQYLMLRYRPTLPSMPERKRRDWIVLFEASAGRDPLLAGTQLDIVRQLLKNAEYDDTFMLLTANTKVNIFNDKPQPARPKNVDEALAFLQKTHLVGALDLEQGLRAALKFAKDAKNPHILHVGSGIAAIGERDAGKLAQSLPASVTYVGVGVGKRWNRAFMKAAAERTNGVFTQINPDEVVSWRAFELLATLNTPRLLDVKVVDAHDKAPTRFLMETTMIAQGEEICAITRVDTNKSAVPGKVIVAGTLDGKKVTRDFVVMNVLPGAGYLPRTWAKLQIDRLLAENAAKHKSEIVELSKAMYVMSPFTSLLVLETDADYEKYKVDKGRKDHWAMYQCPPKIPLVYEPEGKAAPKEVKKIDARNRKPGVNEVLGTMASLAPASPRKPAAQPNWGEGMTLGLEILYDGKKDEAEDAPVYFPPVATWKAMVKVRRGRYEDPDGAVASDLGILRDVRETRTGNLMLGAGGGGRAGGGGANGGGGLLGGLGRNKFDPGTEIAKRLVDADETWTLNAMPTGLGKWVGEDRKKDEGLGDERILRRRRLFYEQVEGQKAFDVTEQTRILRWTGQANGGKGTARRGEEGREGALAAVNSLALGLPAPAPRVYPVGDLVIPINNSSFDFAHGDQAPDAAFRPGAMGIEMPPALLGRKGASLRYERPAFAYDRTVFTDLVQYAPGLLTSDADILATLEAEADVELPKVGSIDAVARQLIDKARGADWAALAIPAQGPLPGFKIAFNGLGQFAYERLLVSGLREQVTCDGKTLTYLYPEIGLASKRAMSRHHQHLITAINPAFLPGADELARGCDLKAIDQRTVALVPFGAAELKQDVKYRRIHLVFGKDGTLSERHIVDMPLGKVVWRQIHHADGSVEWKNGEDKSLAKVERSVTPAQAPNLQANVAELVVVALPIRSPAHLRARAEKLGKDPEREPAVAAECFVSDCLVGNVNRNNVEAFRKTVFAAGDHRLGYFTLLTAAGFNIRDAMAPTSDGQPLAFDLEHEHPHSPLAMFLTQGQRDLANGGNEVFHKNLPGPKDGFLQRLRHFRNLWLAWQNQQPLLNGGADMPLAKAKVIEFLSDTPTPMFAYAILDTMQRRCNTPPTDHMMNLVEKRLGPISDPLGLGYVFKYEQARSIWQTGNGAEAAKLFRELHTNTLKFGVLPPIDPAFRDTLQMPLGAGPRFIAYTRKTLDDLLAKKRYGLAFQLAKQMEQLGDEALSDEILTTILTKASIEERDGLTLVCVSFFSQRKNYLQADRLLVKLFENARPRGEVLRTPGIPGIRSTSSQGLADYPELWRWRSALTKEAGQVAVSIACLEKALDLEYADLPELVNLESIRADYRTLLTHYQKIAEASASLEKSATKAFLAKVIRTADRWRLIDPEHAEPSMMAGKILFTMGERDLAWDYWTTPIDLHPAESRPWLELAATMKAEGDLDKADRAYAIAFEAEPTNPEILWQRAQNAVRLGQPERARQLYRQIADSDWQERFQGTVEQARGLAGQ